MDKKILSNVAYTKCHFSVYTGENSSSSFFPTQRSRKVRSCFAPSMQCITFFKENVATRLCLDDSVKISKNTRRFRCLAEKFAFVKTDYVVSHHCSRTSPHTKFGFVPLPVCGCDCFYISYFIFIIVYIKYSLLLENFVMEPELQIPIVSSKVPPLKTLLCANFKRTHESVIRLLMSKEHIGVDWSPEFKKINLRYNFSEHC